MLKSAGIENGTVVIGYPGRDNHADPGVAIGEGGNPAFYLVAQCQLKHFVQPVEDD